MRKNIATLLTILLAGATIAGCGAASSTSSSSNSASNISAEAVPDHSADASSFMSDYMQYNNKDNGSEKMVSVDIDQKNPIVNITYKDIIHMIDEHDNFIVYFGSSECPYCRARIETMLKAAKDCNINTIYYVDVFDQGRSEWEIDEKGNVVESKKVDDYDNLLSLVSAVAGKYVIYNEDGTATDTDKNKIYAPTLMFIKDNNVTGFAVPEGYEDVTPDATTSSSIDETKNTKLLYDQYVKYFNYFTSTEESYGAYTEESYGAYGKSTN